MFGWLPIGGCGRHHFESTGRRADEISTPSPGELRYDEFDLLECQHDGCDATKREQVDSHFIRAGTVSNLIRKIHDIGGETYELVDLLERIDSGNCRRIGYSLNGLLGTPDDDRHLLLRKVDSHEVEDIDAYLRGEAEIGGGAFSDRELRQLSEAIDACPGPTWLVVELLEGIADRDMDDIASTLGLFFEQQESIGPDKELVVERVTSEQAEHIREYLDEDQ